LSSDFQDTLRRLKPSRHRVPLNRRAESELEFIGGAGRRPAKLLYDTTVYIDILQGRFPGDGDLTLRLSEAWHSPVTESEMAASCGLLDPAHAGTPGIVGQIAAIIDRRPGHRTITPDPEIWRGAGILSGMLARTQGYRKEQRQRVLNDALIFESGRKYGCTVLTRNVVDFDFLQQLVPSGRVMFYRVAAR